MAGALGESHAALSKRLQPNGTKGRQKVLRLKIRGREIVARMFGKRWTLRFDDLDKKSVRC